MTVLTSRIADWGTDSPVVTAPSTQSELCRAVVFLLPLVAITASLSMGCGPDSKNSRSDVVAQVGPDEISSEEFRLSYALGFPHLTRGALSRRENYLQRMIDERLLALEGYRLGLDESPGVQQKVASTRAELLVEKVFEREVNERVVVTDSKIREAIARASVRFKLRYLPATTREQAIRLREVALRDGFEAAVQKISSVSDVPDISDSFESPYLTENLVDETLLAAVTDLGVEQWSDPFAFRGTFIIVQVVDIRRDASDGILDRSARARAEQAQFQREAKKLAREFVTATMAPIDLRIKPMVYGRLRSHLWDWLRVEPPSGNLLEALEGADAEAADSIRALLQKILMTTQHEDWTVERFLLEFPADRYPLSVASKSSFDNDLYDALGLTLRDRVLVGMAEDLRLDTGKEFVDELKRWTDKYVYRALYDSISDSITVSPPESRTYFNRHHDHYPDAQYFEQVEAVVTADARKAKIATTVAKMLERLRERYPVAVRRRAVERVDVSDPWAASAPALTVLKGHTGRIAFPVVDPHW